MLIARMSKLSGIPLRIMFWAKAWKHILTWLKTGSDVFVCGNCSTAIHSASFLVCLVNHDIRGYLDAELRDQSCKPVRMMKNYHNLFLALQNAV